MSARYLALAVALAALACGCEGGCNKTSPRGAGTVPTACGANHELDAGLCYPACNAGFTGAGPLCLTGYPSGFPDQGLECGKPSSYGRGAGSIWGGAGKVKWGGLYYPACATNFHNVGCCVCSPDCPAGTTDIGVSCQKGSYSRGAGTVPGACTDGLELDAGLCYRQCPKATVGRGPLCLSKCALGGYDYYSSTDGDRRLSEEDEDQVENTHVADADDAADAADAAKKLRGTN
jgi:hypothetical protein